MTQDEFGKKALELACHYQNRCCEQEEIIEMFCLDAQAAQERKPLTPAQRAAILKSVEYKGRDVWEVDWGDVIDAVEKQHGITAQQGGGT